MHNIAHWLAENKLEVLEPVFEQNDVDFDVLVSLDENDLRELGLSFGHRKRLMKALATLRPDASSRVTPSTPLEPQPDAAMPAAYSAERRPVTIVFCDLVGSSALAARLDPEEMREVLRSYHHAVASEITRFDGHIAQFLGDGVLAYFGWPKAHEDAAERGVRAALAAVEAVPQLDTGGAGVIAARAGIATGVVVVGEMAAQDGSAVGQTPNLSARLQALGDPGAVVIDATTRRLVGNAFEFRDMGAHEVKGFAEPVESSLVVASKVAESRFEARRSDVLTPLVGRDAELMMLVERWRQTGDGEGQVMLLCGEAGMGKSRIVEGFRETLSDMEHTRLRYQCSPFFASTALYPFIDYLERTAKLQRDDPDAVKLDKLEKLLAPMVIDPTDMQLVATMLSIPTGERYPVLDASPQRQKERLLHCLVTQVVAQSKQSPVLLVFEDAHWSDPTSLAVIDAMIEVVRSERVMLLVTYRPEFDPPWKLQDHVTLQTLRRLSRRQSEAIVRRLAGGKSLPDSVVAEIVRKGDDIPLFLEEITKTVVESGLLTEQDGHYVLDRPLPALAIPATLYDSLLVRLDRLSPVKETAQIGAALGRDFTFEQIALVSPLSEDALGDALSQLVNGELILARGVMPDTVYTFKHALLQDAAYQTLLKTRRVQLHGKIAQTYERRFPEMIDTEPELLAHHFSAAAMPEPAIAYWARAGRRSMERSAYLEAVAHLRRGLAMVLELPAELAPEKELLLLNLLASPLMYTQGYAAPAVWEVYEKAYRLSETSGESGHIFQARCGISTYHMVRSELNKSISLAQDMLDLALERNDHGAIVEGHRLMALDFAWAGRFADADEHAERVRELFDHDNDRGLAFIYGQDHYVSSCVISGLSRAVRGYPDQGRRFYMQALDEATRTDHFFSRGYARSMSIVTLVYLRDVEATRRAIADAVAYCAEQSVIFWLLWAQLFEGWVLLQDGEVERAIERTREAIAAYQLTGSNVQMHHIRTVLAEALARNGQASEAVKLLEEVLNEMRAGGEQQCEAETLRVLGDVYDQNLGDEDSACRFYEESLAVARNQDARLFELRTANRLARIWARKGRGEEGKILLKDLYDGFTEGGDLPDFVEARETLGSLD